jgi:tripartite-type tricarboxylate transporter receptor subunit TctC
MKGIFLIISFSISMLAHSQSYPNKPIRLVVPYAPAGVADIVARLMGEKLGQRLGQTIVVFNREGGGSNVGAELVAKSSPDGYTLLIASTALTMNAALTHKIPYDLQRDLAPVGVVFEQPGVMVVHPSVPANNVQELIAYAKTHPGKLRYGSSGVGGVINLVSELFKYQAKIDLTHVPYKGVAPAMVDLVGGQIDMVISGITNAVPLVKIAKIKALAVTSRKRALILPEVQPLCEQGLPDYETSTWYGIFAPSGTPPLIVKQLNDELSKILVQNDVKDRFAHQGGEVRSGSPEEFRALITQNLSTWKKLVVAAGLKAE